MPVQRKHIDSGCLLLFGLLVHTAAAQEVLLQKAGPQDKSTIKPANTAAAKDTLVPPTPPKAHPAAAGASESAAVNNDPIAAIKVVTPQEEDVIAEPTNTWIPTAAPAAPQSTLPAVGNAPALPADLTPLGVGTPTAGPSSADLPRSTTTYISLPADGVMDQGDATVMAPGGTLDMQMTTMPATDLTAGTTVIGSSMLTAPGSTAAAGGISGMTLGEITVLGSSTTTGMGGSSGITALGAGSSSTLGVGGTMQDPFAASTAGLAGTGPLGAGMGSLGAGSSASGVPSNSASALRQRRAAVSDASSNTFAGFMVTCLLCVASLLVLSR